MKKVILPIIAFTVALSSTQNFAQSNRAFAITSENKGDFNWTVVRELDLSTGEVLKNLYNPSVNKQVIYTSVTGSRSTKLNLDKMTLPMAQGVAAAAFDARHNRLYFTNMRGNDLRYFDLNSGTTSIVVNDDIVFNTGNKYDEANVITRMAFASDGLGYSITNDGKHLLRFTTDQKAAITDLGSLIDAKGNGAMSIHSQCSSWGGDMVGDVYGNLYLVTYRNHVFKINPQTQVADYVGLIKGLPAQFTSNGMAVDANGEMFISSATVADNYYRVNVSTLDASPLQKKDAQVFNASDLANANLLYQSSAVSTDSKIRGEVIGNHALSIYPNPVMNKTFAVKFEKVPAGQYNLVLTDASGRSVIARALNISYKSQLEKIILPRTAAGGVYLVKVTGADKQVVYSNKIMVQ